MHRANAYAALAAELQHWRELPVAELVSRVDAPATVRCVEVHGEPVIVEIFARWADAERAAITIHGEARGPSHWRFERLEERLTVAVKPPARG